MSCCNKQVRPHKHQVSLRAVTSQPTNSDMRPIYRELNLICQYTNQVRSEAQEVREIPAKGRRRLKVKMDCFWVIYPTHATQLWFLSVAAKIKDYSHFRGAKYKMSKDQFAKPSCQGRKNSPSKEENPYNSALISPHVSNLRNYRQAENCRPKIRG